MFKCTLLSKLYVLKQIPILNWWDKTRTGILLGFWFDLKGYSSINIPLNETVVRNEG